LKQVGIPHHSWYEDEPLTLTFPDEWKVHRCKMEAEDGKAMTADEIKAGTHGIYGRRDFVKKLGDDVVSEYQVYNHNPYEMLDYLGETSRGCPVYVNSEVMACDLKIGVGTVLFHRLMGLSGGGKLISPGVAGIETIRYNHGNIGGFGPGLTPHETTGYLCNDDNVMRLDAEEYAGDFVETQRKAAAGTMRWHATESPEADIVVVGSYMRENEPYLGFWPAYNSVKPDGTIVLVNDDPDGDINHWLFNRHGKNIGASLWSPRSRGLAKGKRLIIYGEHPLKSFEMRYEQEIFQWIRSWPEVVEELKKHHGKGSKVAVIPDGTSCIPRKALEG